MFYGLYLAGIIYYLVSGIGADLVHFIDGITAAYILAPCVLMLFCTRSFRAFGRGFLSAFGKGTVVGKKNVSGKEAVPSRKITFSRASVSGKGTTSGDGPVLGGEKDLIARCEESLQAVWMVMLTAVISGGLCFLIGMVDSYRSQAAAWSPADSMIWILLDTTVAALSLLYPMVLCLLLLPVPFLLKKRLTALRAAAFMEGRESAEKMAVPMEGRRSTEKIDAHVEDGKS